MNDTELEQYMKDAKPQATIDPTFTDQVMQKVTEAPAKPKRHFAAWMIAVPTVAVLAIVVGVLALRSPQHTQTSVATKSQSSTQKEDEKKTTSNTAASADTSAVDAALADIQSQLATLPDSDYSSDVLADSALYN